VEHVLAYMTIALRVSRVDLARLLSAGFCAAVVMTSAGGVRSRQTCAHEERLTGPIGSVHAPPRGNYVRQENQQEEPMPALLNAVDP